MKGISKNLYIFIFLGCFAAGIYFLSRGILEVYYLYFSKNIPTKLLPPGLLDTQFFSDGLLAWHEFSKNPYNLSFIQVLLDFLVGLLILCPLASAVYSSKYLLEYMLGDFWQKCKRMFDMFGHICIA